MRVLLGEQMSDVCVYIDGSGFSVLILILNHNISKKIKKNENC